MVPVTIPIRTASTPGMGSLSFFEGGRDIHFDIKRLYYVYAVPKDSRRGGHAHKELNQILMCPYGSIKILLDDGTEKSEFMLDDPSTGLFIGPSIWHDMVWMTSNSVLLVAASDYYDENDYIRNYDDFIRWTHECSF